MYCYKLMIRKRNDYIKSKYLCWNPLKTVYSAKIDFPIIDEPGLQSGHHPDWLYKTNFGSVQIIWTHSSNINEWKIPCYGSC